MTNSNPRHIMMGTHPKGQGGIASVIQGYFDSGFIQRHHILFLPTHDSRQKSSIALMAQTFPSLCRLVVAGLSRSPGILHLHMASRGSTWRKLLLLWIGKKLGFQSILHIHGGEFRHFFEHECSSRQQAYILSALKQARHIIVLNNIMYQWLRKIGVSDKSVSTIYNSIADTQPRLQIKPSKIVLFLGHLSPKKGLDDLLLAFKGVITTYPSALLRIGGNGDIHALDARIKELGLQHHVDYLGWVSGAEKDQQLKQATVVCLPSYHEGFPMTVIEAMAAGTCVLASNVDGIPDAIRHRQEGLLVPPGDIGELRQSLEWLLSNPVAVYSLACAARSRFEARFSEPVITAQLDDLYRRIEESSQ